MAGLEPATSASQMQYATNYATSIDRFSLTTSNIRRDISMPQNIQQHFSHWRSYLSLLATECCESLIIRSKLRMYYRTHFGSFFLLYHQECQRARWACCLPHHKGRETISFLQISSKEKSPTKSIAGEFLSLLHSRRTEVERGAGTYLSA